MKIQMVCAFPFINFRKRRVAFGGDPLFPLFSVFPVGARTIHQFSTWERRFLYARDKMADTVGNEGKIK